MKGGGVAVVNIVLIHPFYDFFIQLRARVARKAIVVRIDRGTKRHKSYGPFASYTYVTRFLAPHEHPLLSVINHPAIIQRFHLEDQCPKYFNTALSLLAKYVHTNIRIFHLQISHTSSDALKFSIRQNVPLHSTPDLTGKQFHIHPCELN